MHSLRPVPDVQRDWEPPGQAQGALKKKKKAPPLLLKSTFAVRERCFHADVCRRPQLLEDVEDTLSCTVFEEDYLSRKLNCECSALILPLSPVLG